MQIDSTQVITFKLLGVTFYITTVAIPSFNFSIASDPHTTMAYKQPSNKRLDSNSR